MVENQKRLSGVHKRQTKRKPKVKKAALKDTVLLLNRLRFGMTPNINRMNAHNIFVTQTHPSTVDHDPPRAINSKESTSKTYIKTAPNTHLLAKLNSSIMIRGRFWVGVSDIRAG